MAGIHTHFTVPQGYCFPFSASPEALSSPPPGLIDNTSIIEAVVKNTPCLLNPNDDGSKDVRPFNVLKAGLVAGRDYAVVPSAVWNVLSKEFGVVGGSNGGLERRYSRAAGGLDAYPLVLRVQVFGNPLISVNVAAASKGVSVSRVKESVTRFLVPGSDAAAA